MRVLAVLAVRVADDDLVAVRTAPAGRDDAAGGDGLHRGAGGDREVDAGVVAAGPGGAGLAVGGAGARVDGGAESGPVRGLGARAASAWAPAVSAGLVLRCLLLRRLLLAAAARGLLLRGLVGFGWAGAAAWPPAAAVAGASTRRISFWPGRIRSGSLPTTARFCAYSRCQPPLTCSESAILESESPRATV